MTDPNKHHEFTTGNGGFSALCVCGKHKYDLIHAERISTLRECHELCELDKNHTGPCLVNTGNPPTDKGNVNDNVNHPAHYTSGGVECIDAIEAMLTPEEYRGFLKGQVVKYQWRAGKKTADPTEDLDKLNWYLDRQRALPVE